MTKRKKQWERELQEGIEEYEKNTNQEYDRYGKIQRYKNVKFKKEINWNKIIRYILGISLIAYQILKYLGKI